ncbi:MAG TPA: nuclear transport factor 2 family protein [Ferruginibacter sp.]|nr:nuclear transport factor 2 family protein [Ferruginibacter sp.]HMP20104.1 nuclear transport factor 2 family protein [Ferruginibacter sp.]
MKKMLLWAACACFFIGCANEQPAETTATTAATNSAAAEIGDYKYAEVGKKGVDALSRGDVDGWTADFADNAVYIWNNGDSLAGKAAITDYWKKRRTETIDSISFSNAIFLPVKVNQPQSVEQAGNWLLCWYKVDAKYKPTGKKMTQWIHTDMHFTDAGKIDRCIQYLDRTLINAAMTK